MMTEARSLFVAMAAAVVAVAPAEEWGTDYTAALVRAQREGRAVLVNFTGSDWCGFCMRLKAEVLDDPEFAAWAGESFVLLEVDMPRRADVDPELLARNREICSRYAVEGFPTLLVLDEQGRALGGLAGFEGDRHLVRKVLSDGLRACELLRQGDSLQGEQKLACLLAVWKLLPDELRRLNPGLRAEIISLDEQDVSGLRAEAEAERRLRDCRSAVQAAPTDAAALSIVDEALRHAVPTNRRQLLEIKHQLLFLLAEDTDDICAAAEVAYAAIEADLRYTPQQKELLLRQLRAVYANPQTQLNRSRSIRRKRPAR